MIKLADLSDNHREQIVKVVKNTHEDFALDYQTIDVARVRVGFASVLQQLSRSYRLYFRPEVITTSHKFQSFREMSLSKSVVSLRAGQKLIINIQT